MTTLRTTVIMKTDISSSTVRFRALGEADLHALLTEHRDFLNSHAAPHGGYIVKPEGDGFWLVFPSVTAAAMAAMAMQEELRLAQLGRADDRVALRVVITLGDVLHEEGALVGDTIVLTTRIESLTPPDEIYLSASAWLAANQAEIRTAFVDTFSVKGFTESVPVYRVEQTHRTRVIAGQCIVLTDLRGFGKTVTDAPMATIERMLETLFTQTNRVAREFSGTVRFNAGDAYCLTFADASLAMAAAEGLNQSWDAFVRQEKLSCPLNVAVHQGMLYTFRSYFYGPGIDIAASVQAASRGVLALDEGSIFVTGEVQSSLAGSIWERRLALVDVQLPRHAELKVYRLENQVSAR